MIAVARERKHPINSELIIVKLVFWAASAFSHMISWGESRSCGSGCAAFLCCLHINMSLLCTLAALFLTFEGLLHPGEADVGDFTPCLHFFYKLWPSKGLSGTPICQRYCNQYRFATLYSRARRSPWFSAYVYSAPQGKRPKASWKFEPQVSRFQRLPIAKITIHQIKVPLSLSCSPDGKIAESSLLKLFVLK